AAIRSPIVLSPCTKQEMPSGIPLRASTSVMIAWQATAVIGVFSDGFHTHTSPHTQAMAAFQLHTATGKLNAEMTPTMPKGCHCSYIRCCGRSDWVVSP